MVTGSQSCVWSGPKLREKPGIMWKGKKNKLKNKGSQWWEVPEWNPPIWGLGRAGQCQVGGTQCAPKGEAGPISTWQYPEEGHRWGLGVSLLSISSLKSPRPFHIINKAEAFITDDIKRSSHPFTRSDDTGELFFLRRVTKSKNNVFFNIILNIKY
jgi:hypothetical protein